MVQKTLPELISATEELAALPISVVRMLELLDDPTASADRILAVVQNDPSLTSNLLKLCNSAYYGLRRKIGSVREALVMLGNKTVVTLAVASGMGDVLRGPLAAYGIARDEMWRHALATGIGASYLTSQTYARELRDRAFTAGLVHDIGKLLLNKLLSEQVEMLPPATGGQSVAEDLSAAEERLLGYDHSVAGAALAEAWNFPPMLVMAIRYHHSPQEATQNTELVLSVAAADLIAKSLGLTSGHTTGSCAADLETLTDHGIPEETIRQLIDHLLEDVDELQENLARE
jgi:HD-like signal output (HDOD) protein